MSVSTVITMGFGSFGTVKFLPSIGYGNYGNVGTLVYGPIVASSITVYRPGSMAGIAYLPGEMAGLIYQPGAMEGTISE